MKWRTMFLICITAGLLTSCGDGGDDDTRFVAGIWRGILNIAENDCAIPNQTPSFSFRHTVNQNDEIVVVDTERSQHFIGETVGDEGFSADAAGAQNQSIGGGVTCNFTNRIEYDEIFEDDDSDAAVEFRIIRNCSNSTECTVLYRGTATR